MLLHFNFSYGKAVDIDVDPSINLGVLKLILRENHLRHDPRDTNRTIEEIHITTQKGEAVTSPIDPFREHSISPGDTLDVHLDPNDDLFFKTQSGMSGCLRVKFDTVTIKDVQVLIEERLSWPMEQFGLVYFPDFELEQSKTIQEYGIPKEATIRTRKYPFPLRYLYQTHWLVSGWKPEFDPRIRSGRTFFEAD